MEGCILEKPNADMKGGYPMSQMTYDQLVGAVTGLPLADQQRLLKLLAFRLEGNGVVEYGVEVVEDSPQPETLVALHPNQLWLRANRDDYRGQWVVLYNGELVAHGTDGIAAVDAARLKGIPEPFVAFIPAEDRPFAGF
jgi:hypothetical protein